MQRFTKSKSPDEFGRAESNDPQPVHGITRGWKPAVILAFPLAVYLLIEAFVPLRTTIQIGGDEGFELAKATLCLKGYKLYTDVWNDQPPLHTFLLTEPLKHFSPSILAARLITVGFTVVLLASVFIMAMRVSGLWIAAITTGLIIASPGFIGLSSSCMLEIPALAPAMAALCLLLVGRQTKWHVWEILAGVLFAASFQIKLINVILLPLSALILWLRYREALSPTKGIIWPLLLLGVSLTICYVAIDCLIEKGAYLRNFQQSWTSHFGTLKSAEYGSPSDYPFDWRILLKNWDTTIPALLGVIFCFRQIRKVPMIMLPLALFGLTLVIFTIHKPWWPYYYIHIAIPVCWCAAVGVEAIRQRISSKWIRLLPIACGLYALCALTWMGARVYLQIREIRNSAQTYSSLVLTEIGRYKPYTKWIYADKVIYSFHAGIPVPPPLALVMLKRL